MRMDKDPYKITKAGLIRAVSVSAILIVVALYAMYMSGILPKGEIGQFVIIVIVGSALIALSSFIGIKLGRKNYTRLKMQFEETKKIKGIANFGMLSIIFGLILLGKPNPVELLFAFVWMAAGLGLIMVRKIGRRIFIIIASISVLFIAFDFVFGGGIMDVTSKYNSQLPLLVFISMRMGLIIFCVFGLYYFTRPNIKYWFKS